MSSDFSPLQTARLRYQPRLPGILKDLSLIGTEKEASLHVPQEIVALFPKTQSGEVLRFVSKEKKQGLPKRVGVVFSGGQAPGGHNVISGLFDGLKQLNAGCELIGFLGGPSGIVANKTLPLDANAIAPFRNQGGFDLIGSGRTKIETDEQFKAVKGVITSLKLDGLVIIGGDDSNTNAALLAEYFKEQNIPCNVIGVPKTIDGDLQNAFVPISFGFDTACRVYSEEIGNLLKDCISAKKYTHFVKLMGRAASHIALECALQTHPNMVLIGEEVGMKGLKLKEITAQIADLVQKRSEAGKNYGLILIPEGLIEFIPEVKKLIKELNAHQVSKESQACFDAMPKNIQEQLMLHPDPHGNIQVAAIETEKLLIESVSLELKARGFKGSFSPLAHSLGYEGRAALPTNFDSDYCYALGHVAAAQVHLGLSGTMCFVKGEQVGALPLTALMNLEERKGKKKPVIAKALVDLNGKPFEGLKRLRESWMIEDHYRSPGPIQFEGGEDVARKGPLILSL